MAPYWAAAAAAAKGLAPGAVLLGAQYGALEAPLPFALLHLNRPRHARLRLRALLGQRLELPLDGARSHLAGARLHLELVR